MMSTIFRLDAAIQQISADQRRLQDELRSVTYELQQVPMRVTDRVTAAIADASDPFDQGVKILKMSRELADGYPTGQEKESGIAEIIAAAAGALASRGGAPLPPPQEAAPAPIPAAAPAPQPTNGSHPPTNGPTLVGMTPEKEAVIRAESAKRGIGYDAAIAMAARNGLSADMLIAAAKAQEASTTAGP